MGAPGLFRNVDFFVPEILQLTVQDKWKYRIVCTRLLDRQKLYGSRMIQVAFRLPNQAAQREWRDGPQEPAGWRYWDTHVRRMAWDLSAE